MSPHLFCAILPDPTPFPISLMGAEQPSFLLTLARVEVWQHADEKRNYMNGRKDKSDPSLGGYAQRDDTQ